MHTSAKKPLKILWFETGDLHSVRAGREAGKKLGVQVDTFDTYDFNFFADGKDIGAFSGKRDIVAEYDALVVRSFMPFVAEALTLARLFRAAGKEVIDESLTEEGFAMSKMHDYIRLAEKGVDIPRTRQFFDGADAAEFAKELGYPCVIKGTHGSEGRHVYKVDSEKALRKHLMRYRAGEVMIQEYLDAEVDYRVIVVGYKALPVYVSRKPQDGEFRTNFEFNEEVISLPLKDAPALKTLAENACKALKREFSAVDIRCRGEKPLVLEANRRPGFRGFEQVTGFDVGAAFIEYVIEKCGRNAGQKEKVYA